jgi:hypothetical protein
MAAPRWRAVSTEKLRYILARLRGLLRPPVTMLPAPEAEVIFARDVAAAMRDGTTLRVHVFRPRGEGPHPVRLVLVPVIASSGEETETRP